MPYHVEKRGDQWCVVKKATNEPVPGGCHPSATKAVRHMRALYANVDEKA